MEIEGGTVMIAKNPILNGFYPDPSICAVGEDFYMVTSTFSYFPGVPIFHSTNLCQWEQIGNVLTRPSQLPLEGSGHSDGIYAPTIRYSNGVFYMITTNVSSGGNFIVTASNPAGPWSDPYYLGEQAPGIDPSLFFDDDGTCYYVGTRPNPDGVRYNGDWEIWAQELDVKEMILVGESYKLWKGAMNGVIWPEGPHLYKKGEYYYLMIAEGGTGPDHCITIARSHTIFGPYVGNPDNPILTHRHLGKQYPIVYVGHGDLVKDVNDHWYVVMLASRTCEGYTYMGRETFLATVCWEDDWPVVNPGVGKLQQEVEVSLPSIKQVPKSPIYSFYNKELSPDMLLLRNPSSVYEINEKEGRLRLWLQAESLKDLASPAYIGVRQRHHKYQVGTMLRFDSLLENECAGLAILQSNTHHIRFEKRVMDNHSIVRVIQCEQSRDTIVAQCTIEDGPVMLRIVNRGSKADFYYEQKGKILNVCEDIAMQLVSTEIAGGFTGCTIGMYASSNGVASSSYADFEWFFYGKYSTVNNRN